MTESPRRDAALALLALALLLAWDASGLDLAVARRFGGVAGFAARGHWLARDVLHDGGRALAWGVLALLGVGIWRPLPFAGRLPRARRVWWFATVLACLAVVTLLKQSSLTSCPWSLAEFGGQARVVSHWQWGVADGGDGRCFPSGHAAAAFALLAGVPALRRDHPRAARCWLAGVLVLGLLFGAAQTVRGAHFVSHSLWTAWLCWAVTLASHHLHVRLARRGTA